MIKDNDKILFPHYMDINNIYIIKKTTTKNIFNHQQSYYMF